MTDHGERAWANACLALSLLAVDPAGLRGIALRARPGPVRDAFLDLLHREIRTVRVHPAMPREALFGGLDLAATLSAGRIVRTRGLLAREACMLLVMAERCGADRAGELSRRLEEGGRQMILLDEGSEPGEAAPPALMERLAFHVSLDGIGRLQARIPASRRLDEARDRLGGVSATEDALRRLVLLSARLGVDSMRAPHFALRAARASAALRQRPQVEDEDVAVGASLVIAPRATVLPELPDGPKPGEGRPPDAPETGADRTDSQVLPDDILVEIVRPHLPPDLVAGLAQGGRAHGARGAGAGRRRRSNRRGRPLPSRPGRPCAGARVDLAATLREAAPWQGLRRREGPVRVLPSDIRLKRHEEGSDRLLVFAVDASGSAAMARLGDAKGAVETLLSRAYASRDHVALVAFRGERADLLLPPTRSLVQARRRLTALPGGGGTPLAAGLRAAGDLALHARGQGLTPMLLLLTDGRANIALDGSGNRAKAREQATAVARGLRAEGLPSIVIDTGIRPQAALSDLARALAGQYLPLPRADAAMLGKTLDRTIRDGLET